MNRDPHQLAEYELPEWHQVDQEEARKREAERRVKVALVAFAIGFAGVLAAIQFVRAGGLG